MSPLSCLYLAIAILFECVATSSMRAAQGFTRPGPSAVVIAGYAIAFFCLSRALRDIPTGIAYAIWSGVGIMLIAAVAWIAQGQRLDAPALIGMALIVAGVVVITTLSRATVG